MLSRFINGNKQHFNLSRIGILLWFTWFNGKLICCKWVICSIFLLKAVLLHWGQFALLQSKIWIKYFCPPEAAAGNWQERRNISKITSGKHPESSDFIKLLKAAINTVNSSLWFVLYKLINTFFIDLREFAIWLLSQNPPKKTKCLVEDYNNANLGSFA